MFQKKLRSNWIITSAEEEKSLCSEPSQQPVKFLSKGFFYCVNGRKTFR